MDNDYVNMAKPIWFDISDGEGEEPTHFIVHVHREATVGDAVALVREKIAIVRGVVGELFNL